MIKFDVILFNDCGCEIARETATNEKQIDEIISSWTIYAGDKIEIENAPVEYFNLQGVRVANPENGLYIRRQGNKVEKIFLRK